MALFFDQAWFTEKLEAVGLAKVDLARALGLTSSELEAMWKDQREISEREIKTMALILGVSEAEVRNKGGLQGSPEARRAALGQRSSVTPPQTASVEERLTRIEAQLESILAKLDRE